MEGGQAFTLRIDEPSAELREAHARNGVSCSAFLTACNPGSQRIVDHENRRRHATLIRVLTAAGLRHWPGFGIDPDRSWPDEPSRLVFGIPLDEARTLGKRFAQNAMVWAGADAVPRLVLLR